MFLNFQTFVLIMKNLILIYFFFVFIPHVFLFFF